MAVGYPRRYQSRSVKWQLSYIGPFLVVRLIEPVNCVLQRTAKSKPFVVHVDKLKKCFSATPTSWLQTGSYCDQQERDRRSEAVKRTTREVVDSRVAFRVHRCNASQLHLDPVLLCRLRKHQFCRRYSAGVPCLCTPDAVVLMMIFVRSTRVVRPLIYVAIKASFHVRKGRRAHQPIDTALAATVVRRPTIVAISESLP